MNDQSIKTESDLEEYTIQLLQEKLKIDRTRRKIGEVVIRKVIETNTIEIPIRQEKLIVEQIGDATVRLAEVNLSREIVTGIDSIETTQTNGRACVEGTFSSLEQAVEILAMIARQTPHGCTDVQVKLFLENSQYQQTYQIMFQQSAEKEK